MDNKKINYTPIPFRGGGFHHKNNYWISPFVFITLLTLWHLGTTSGFISNLVLPKPIEVAIAFHDLHITGDLYLHLGASLSRLSLGWTLGTIFGIILGFAIGLFSTIRSGLAPIVAAIFPVPKIALLPLFIIWFGIGELSKVNLILFGTLFPTIIATYGAIDNVDRSLIRMGQSFNLSWISIARKIILPASLPAILSSMRITAAIAIILIVAAELIAAEKGIGAYIQMAGSLFAIDRLLAGIIILSCLGLIANWIIGFAERKMLKWRN
ncbi:MAG: ABC transporter permease [Rhodospirillaceae bacterium]|jgi:ABC-type nitrate/sulfonate/bicarbonate transport system permease component|nr:ABC transporter permease [Rhodospirillaceae bacterium]